MSYPSSPSYLYTPTVNVLERDQRMNPEEIRPGPYHVATENPTNSLHAMNPMYPPTSSLSNNVASNNVATNNVTTNNMDTKTMEHTTEKKTYNLNSILLTAGIVGILVCFLVVTLTTKSTQHPLSPQPKTN